MRRWFFIGGLLAVLGVTSLVLILARRDGETTEKKGSPSSLSSPGKRGEDIPQVTVAQVVAKRLEETVRLPGELQPFLSVDLYPKVTALLQWIGVDRGSRVKRGEVLVRLMAPELLAQRAEAEAKLRSDEITYERLKTAATTPGVVAPNDLEVAKLTVEADRARVRSLKQMEEYLVITAPFDGVVTTRNVHLGALVGPAGGGGGANPPLVRLEQIDHLRLTVPVPEPYSGTIAPGKKVQFWVPAFPNRTFEGTIARVAHSVDVKTRTMPVEMDVDNSSGLLLAPGMFPEVQWPVQRGEESLFVPVRSIVTTTELTFVIRVRQDTVEWIKVRKGHAVGDLIEVFGDLNTGDVVMARGSDELRPGTKVTTVSPAGT